MITFISYIGEAISMADKVIVLTKRPGTIKKIYTVFWSGFFNKGGS